MTKVTIYGAGIFGLTLAWMALKRGAQVTVIDPAGPASGASGGIVGALLTGVFSATALGGAGLGDGNETIFAQVIAQAIGVVATVVYTGIVTFILLKLVQMMMGLRVEEEEESEGLNISQHDETGYNL